MTKNQLKTIGEERLKWYKNAVKLAHQRDNKETKAYYEGKHVGLKWFLIQDLGLKNLNRQYL